MAEAASFQRHGSIPNSREAGVSAAKAMWNKYMALQYDEISASDLEAEHNLDLFSEFCGKLGENPPLKATRQPYGLESLKKYVRHLINDLKRAFGNNDFIKNGPEFFAANDVTQLLKTLELSLIHI